MNETSIIPIVKELISELIKIDSPLKMRTLLDQVMPPLDSEGKLIISESKEYSEKLKKHKQFELDWWFITRQQYEQSSSMPIADFHAKLFMSNQVSHILDLTAGAGIDAFAFLKAGLKVVSYEINPRFYRNLLLNKTFYNRVHWSVLNENGLTASISPNTGIYLDPSRINSTGKRIFNINETLPSFKEIITWLGNADNPILVKHTPLLDMVNPELNQWKKIVVGYQNECKEIVLAKNLKGINSTSCFIIERNQFIDSEHLPETHFLSDRPCIYEPHPALIKAQLEETVSFSVGLTKPDPNCGYFFGAELSDVKHLYKQYYLIDIHEYRISDINMVLEKYNPIEVVFKKRNSSVKIDHLKYKSVKNGHTQKVIVLISTLKKKDVFWLATLE